MLREAVWKWMATENYLLDRRADSVKKNKNLLIYFIKFDNVDSSSLSNSLMTFQMTYDKCNSYPNVT